MIIGKVENLNRYLGLNNNLDLAIAYILKTDLLSLENATHTIDGENVYLNRFSYNPSPEEDCFFEGHKKYLDIHLVLSGEELLGYADESDLTALTEYDQITDFIKYEGKVSTYCKCSSGDFIIVFPEDIHMPKIAICDALIEKAVCKVLVN